jgi:hypothetical protein
MVYPSVVTALTEVPATLCLTASFVVLFQALGRTGCKLYLAAIGASLLLSAAVLGRQNIAVVLFPLGWLVWRMSRDWLAVLALAFLPLATGAALFALWGGPVPPRHASANVGWSLQHFIAVMAYLGFAACILDPAWLLRHWRLAIVVIVTAFVVNHLFQLVTAVTPMRNTVVAMLEHNSDRDLWLARYSVLAGSALIALCLIGGWYVLDRWIEINTPVAAACAMAVLLFGATYIKSSHLVAGRYLFPVLPLLLLLAAHEKGGWKPRLFTAVVGILLGLNSAVRTLPTADSGPPARWSSDMRDPLPSDVRPLAVPWLDLQSRQSPRSQPSSR